MKYLTFAAILLLAITELAVLINALKSRRPISTLLLNAFVGLSSMAIIDLTAKYTGVFIPINPYTVAGCSSLGIPAVLGFLLCKALFL